MSESLVTKLTKLRDARLTAKGAPDEEVTLLEMAIDRLGELGEDQTTIAEGQMVTAELIVPSQQELAGRPLTTEGVLTWAAERAKEHVFVMSQEDNAEMLEVDKATVQSVLAGLLAGFFAQQYTDWKQSELLELVCNWDLAGVRGWNQYTTEELVETFLEEAKEFNVDGDTKITTVEEAANIMENWS